MYQRYQLTLTTTADAADLAQEWIAARCAEQQMNSRQAFQMSLGTAEVVNNILRHSPADASESQFHLQLLISLNSVELEVIHRAPPYRVPRPRERAETTEALLAESGRGWQILRQWFSRIEYQFEGGANRLKLCKRTSACVLQEGYPYA